MSSALDDRSVIINGRLIPDLRSQEVREMEDWLATSNGRPMTANEVALIMQICEQRNRLKAQEAVIQAARDVVDHPLTHIGELENAINVFDAFQANEETK